MNAFVCCCCRQLSPPKHQLAGIAALLTSGVALLLFDLSACLALPVIVRKVWINKNKNVAHFVISNCTVSLSTARREIWSCFRCGKRLPCVVVRVSIQRTLHRARGNVQQYDDYIIYSDICCKKKCAGRRRKEAEYTTYVLAKESLYTRCCCRSTTKLIIFQNITAPAT